MKDLKIKVGVVGAAGYTASELLRLLAIRDDIDSICAVSESMADKSPAAVYPDLISYNEFKYVDELAPVDVVFLCGGHGASIKYLEQNSFALAGNPIIIDLSTDFRIKGDHGFVYGLTEIYKGKIKEASYVANPGCFATLIQLSIIPLLPVLSEKSDIHITAITGSTGAGRLPTETTHFSNRQNNLSAYKAFSHQHEREIYQSFAELSAGGVPHLYFVPVRGNFPRGIYATIQIKTQNTVNTIRELYENAYHDEPFVHFCDNPVNLKQCINTNNTFIHAEKHGDMLHITSCLDNLLKGASGQAIQNMNVSLGKNETAGLKLKPLGF